MNKVMLIGNVGVDPEIRYVDAGVCTAQVRLATTTRGYTLPGGMQVPDRTEWHRLLFWRGLAETVERYVHKGDKLYVEGELRYRTFTDKRGIERHITEIWVSNMEMLTPKAQSPMQMQAQQPAQQPQQAVQQPAAQIIQSQTSEEPPF